VALLTYAIFVPDPKISSLSMGSVTFPAEKHSQPDKKNVHRKV
jgi:hypothetical protein